MSWKTIVIKESQKINLKNNQLLVTDENKKITFSLNDLNCIILENNYTTLTTQLLSALVYNNVFLLICDSRHDPVGVLLGLNRSWRPLEVLEKQIELDENLRACLWQSVVKQKIFNSLIVLQNNNSDFKACSKIKKYYKTVMPLDVTNREGQAARVFFRELYGTNFIRFADDNINAALNYGYKILASAISRTLIKYGFEVHLGIFHKGRTNPFNLAYDLLEPFRPMVDNWVSSHLDELCGELTYNQRLELVNLLNLDIFIDNQVTTVTIAIDVMVKSFLSCLLKDDPLLLKLPVLLIDENKQKLAIQNLLQNIVDNEW